MKVRFDFKPLQNLSSSSKAEKLRHGIRGRDRATADLAGVRLLPRCQALGAGRPSLDEEGQGQEEPEPLEDGSAHHHGEIKARIRVYLIGL